MRRQSNVFTATVMAASIAGAVTVSAQPSPRAQVKPAPSQLAPGLSSKPYSRLFEQQLPEISTAPRSEVLPNSARRFICAMPMLPADSAIDPRFEMRPRDTTTQFSMRVVPAVQCQ